MKAKRRGHGEGSLYWREDRKRWVVEFDHGYIDGRRKRTARTFKTQREAARHLADARKALLDGLPAPDQRLRMGAFLDYWLDGVVDASGRKPSTKASYRDNVELHIKPTLGHLRLAQLRYEDVQTFGKARDGYSVSTLRTLMVVLRMALDHAVVMEKATRNVARNVPVPKTKAAAKIIAPLSREHGERLLAAAEGDRLYSLYVLLAMVGLRRGEVLALRWDDVDLDTGRLRVERQVQRVHGTPGLVVGPPKSRSARRVVSLPRYCVAVLRQHRQRQMKERLAAGESWRGHGLVFPTKVGTHIEPRNLNRHMEALCRRARLEPQGLHALRHTAATMAFALGVDWKQIQAMLGHSALAVTMDTYVDRVPDLEQRAADLIDAGFGRVKDPLAVNLAVTDERDTGA